MFGDSTTTSVQAQNDDEVRFQSTGGFFVSPGGISAESGTDLGFNSNGRLVDVSASSARYKTNVEPLGVDTAPVLDLEPKTFEFEENGDPGVGFVAEDVDETFPELVRYDEQGRPDGINYKRLGVFLLPEIRENRDRLDRLESTADRKDERIEALEAENERLREELADRDDRIADLERRLASLEARVDTPGLSADD